jgi:hypothetical protein
MGRYALLRRASAMADVVFAVHNGLLAVVAAWGMLRASKCIAQEKVQGLALEILGTMTCEQQRIRGQMTTPRI